MADKKFNVELTAVDKFTANMDRFNKKLERMMAPATKLQARVNQVTASLAKNPMAKFMKNIGHATAFVYRGMTSLLTPLAAIIGAGSIAGITALANAWGKFGYNVLFASRMMGINTTKYQQFAGAARLMHVDPATATQEVAGLGQRYFHAMMYGEPGERSLIKGLGIRPHYTKTGEIDDIDFARQLADKVQSNPALKNGQALTEVFNALGINGSAGMYLGGSKALDSAMAAAQRANPAQTADNLKSRLELYNNAARLSEAFSGLTTLIENRLIPKLSPLLGGAADYLTKNRVGISRDLGVLPLNPPLALKLLFDHWMDAGTLPGNNPTNLYGWKGTSGIASFRTPAAGLLHAAERLRYLGSRGANTINSLMGQWDVGLAPEQVARHVQDVSSETSLGANDKLDLSDPNILRKLLPGLIMAEQGSNYVDPADIGSAVDKATAEPMKLIIDLNLIGHKPTATVHDGKGNRQPVSIRNSVVGHS